MRRILLTVIASIVLSTGVAAAAYAHNELCCGGVGVPSSGEWMQIQDNSKYNVWRYCCSGINSFGWDVLNCRWPYGGQSCPGVDLDVVGIDSGAAGPANLVVQDTYIPRGTWGGQVRCCFGTPNAYLTVNKYYADTKNDVAMASLFNHELGHAIAFRHPPDTPYYWRNSIMPPCSDCHGYPHAVLNNNTSPHDISDYISRWLYHSRGPS